jgi:hypothetical protein
VSPTGVTQVWSAMKGSPRWVPQGRYPERGPQFGNPKVVSQGGSPKWVPKRGFPQGGSTSARQAGPKPLFPNWGPIKVVPQWGPQGGSSRVFPKGVPQVGSNKGGLPRGFPKEGPLSGVQQGGFHKEGFPRWDRKWVPYGSPPRGSPS